MGEAAQGIADNAITQFAQAVLESMSKALTSLGTAWVQVPSINLESSTAAKFVTDHTGFIVVALLTASLIAAGIRLAWTKRMEPVKDIISGLFQFIIISVAGISIMSLCIKIADETSKWIINQASGGTGFAQSMIEVFALGNIVAPGVGFIVIILGGIIAIVANLIQIGLLFVRSALLLLLAGVMVIPAAMPGSVMGKEWLKKLGGWFLAFLLFKPAASIIYATGIILIKDGSILGGADALVAFAMGMLFLVLAPIALPALMAFIVPSVAALGAGGAGGAGAAMAAGSMASGAANVVSKNGSGSGSESSMSSSHASESSTQSSATDSASTGAHATPGASSGAGPSAGSAGVGATGGTAAGTSNAGGGVAAGSAGAGSAGAGSAGAAAGAGAATGGASLALQAGAQGTQQAIGAVQGMVDSETGGATGAGETSE